MHICFYGDAMHTVCTAVITSITSCGFVWWRHQFTAQQVCLYDVFPQLRLRTQLPLEQQKLPWWSSHTKRSHLRDTEYSAFRLNILANVLCNLASQHIPLQPRQVCLHQWCLSTHEWKRPVFMITNTASVITYEYAQSLYCCKIALQAFLSSFLPCFLPGLLV